MELEDEDVDVIFEDSVLHQALSDCGFTTLETESKAAMEWEKPCDNRNSDSEEAGQTSELLQSWRPSRLARVVYPLDFLKEVELYHRYETLQRLMSSRMLLAEDRHFLQEFVEESQPVIILTENFTVWTRRLISLLLVMTVLVNVSLAPSFWAPWLGMYLEQFRFVNILSVHHHITLAVLVNIAWCLFVLIFMRLLSRRMWAELYEAAQSWDAPLQHLESEAWELMHLQRKCLRLVRESELVARGFTLANHHHYNSKHSGGQRSTVDKLCPKLRLTMVMENTELLAAIKAAVVTMMKRVVMRVSDSDFSTLEELPCLDTATLTQEDADDDGDPIPMASLSKSVSLLQIYISACMRKLALCFYQRNLRDPTLNPYEATLGCAVSCTEVMTHAHSAIREHHSYYRAVHQSTQQRDTTGLGEVAQVAAHSPSLDGLQPFYLCVNSLDLHLQAVRLMTRELLTDLEARVDHDARRRAGQSCLTQSDNSVTSSTKNAARTGDNEDSPTTVSREDWKAWGETLKGIKTSLDSIRCCYDESVNHLCPKDKSNVSAKPPAEEPDSCSEDTGEVKVKVVPAEDPVIIDQVFEAVTDPAGDEDDEEDMAGWRRQRQLAAQDRARLQDQRETMKRLKQELSAVVGHRAIIQRAREERALARARGEELEEEDTGEEGRAVAQIEGDLGKMDDVVRPSDTGEKEEEEEEFEGKARQKLSEEGRRQDGEVYINSKNVKGMAETKMSVLSPDECAESENTESVGDRLQDFGKNLLKIDKALEFHCAEVESNRECGKTTRERKIEGGLVQETNLEKGEHKQDGIFSAKDYNCSSGNAALAEDVLEPYPRDCKTGCDNAQKLNAKGIKVKGSSVIDESKEKKFASLERELLGMTSDFSRRSGGKHLAGTDMAPDLSHTNFDTGADAETKSLIVREEGEGEMASEETSSGYASAAQDDALSDSSSAVKSFWKRPAPPRVWKRLGVQYVVPVNLITVGVVLQGASGASGSDGGDTGGDGGKKGKDEGERSSGKDDGGGTGRDEGNGRGGSGSRENRRRRHSAESSRIGNTRGDGAGAEGGRDPAKLPPTEEEPQPVGLCEKVDTGPEARARRKKEHWARCELSIMDHQAEAHERQQLRQRERRAQAAAMAATRAATAATAAATATTSTTTTSTIEPFLVYCRPRTIQLYDEEHDPDLVGGLRLSPEWRRRIPPLSDDIFNSPVVDHSILNPEGVALNRYVSRHNFPQTRRIARAQRGLHRRRYSSDDSEDNTATSENPWLPHSSTAPELARANSERTGLLSSTPTPTSPPLRVMGEGSNPEDDPDSSFDKWVKVTHHNMVSDNGSRVQVIRQKDMTLGRILAHGASPIPSPEHNSSFSHSLAKMAAAQAHIMLRSENVGILGREETFGDDSDDEGDQL